MEQTTDITNVFEREIPTWVLSKVVERVSKVNAKAAKLSIPGFTLNVGERFIHKSYREDGSTRLEERVHVSVTGDIVQLNGYRFLGRVDFEGDLTLVNARPGEVVPARYRTATPFCDHCASKRKRNAVFIFRRDGGEQHIQVGRTCLADFLGHDPAAVLSSLFSDLADEIDEDCRGAAPHEVAYVDDILAMAAAVIRVQGTFVSKAAAEIRQCTTTSSEVFSQLFRPSPIPKGFIVIEREQQDVDRAAEAKAWCLDTMHGSGRTQSEYEHNLHQLVGAKTVELKRIGILTSLIGVYARHLGELVKRAQRVNAYVGEAGARREFDATFSGTSSYDNAYGTVFIGRFETPEGLLVYKGSSPFWRGGMKAGEQLRFVATIKKHDDYQGTKQTLIQRVKLVEQVAA